MPKGTKTSDAVKRVLARFPRPVVMRPTKRKIRRAMIAMLITVLGWFVGLLLVHMNDDRGLVIGWICVVFSPLFGIHILTTFLPGRTQLTLDKGGMTIINGLFRRRELWPDVSRISATKIKTGSTSAGFVSFNSRAAIGTFSGIFNSALSRGNSFIPDMYELGPDEMVQVLKLWRDRALKGTKKIPQ